MARKTNTSQVTIDGFRTWLAESGRSLETADLYAVDIKVLMAEYERPVLGLIDRDKAPSTRRHRRAALRSWCEYAGDDELLGKIRKIRLPHPSRVKPKVPMTREERELLIRRIDEIHERPMRATLGIMAARGLRVSDVLRLRRGEVRTALAMGRLVYEAKGERRLEYKARPIMRYLEDLASAPKWTRVDELISPASRPDTRRRMAKQRASRMLKRICKEIGIDPASMHLHRLRRTYASLFLDELKNDPRALQKLQEHMQWANLSTAAGYTDFIREEELDEVAEKLEVA